MYRIICSLFTVLSSATNFSLHLHKFFLRLIYFYPFLFKRALILFLAVAGILFISCSDENITNPEPVYGWQGTIMSDSGKVIEGVKIYCLYYYHYIPQQIEKTIGNFEITDSVFTNSLYQNIPNPVTGETYIRFAVKKKSFVELKVSNRLNGESVKTFSDTLDYGLYQHSQGELAFDPDIKNGIYDFSLKITPISGEVFEDSKELIVIGNQNKPNAESDEKGYYLFDFREAFVGSVVKEVSMYNQFEIFERVIPEEVFLLFKKEGYWDEIVKFQMLPGVLFTRDIILTGGNPE